MTSLPTWSLFLLLMTGTCHQLCAEKEEETYEQREEKKGSKIKKYIKPQYLIVTLLTIVGSSFVYFRYIKEGDKNPEKPLKDSEKDDLRKFIDASGVGDEAKRKKLNEKIRDRDLSAKQLDELPTQEIINELELSDEYAPILEEIKQKLKKEEQEDSITEKENSPVVSDHFADDWTTNELTQWVKSLNEGTFTTSNKQQIVDAINTKKLTGKSFASMKNADEMQTLLSIEQTVSQAVYDMFQQVKPRSLLPIESTQDLVDWINSLKTLTKNEKEKLVEKIEIEEISGKSFLKYLTSQQEIEEDFQVDSTTAKKLYDALIKLKRLPKVGPNSGLIGLENFNGDEANICYLNAAIQLLLQNPPLVKELRERQYFKKNKYVTKKENDPEQDMWAGFVELAQQAIQPNA
ncbi:MAG: hypothetical protein AAF335_05165, partial [Bacteroidota bacterium]